MKKIIAFIIGAIISYNIGGYVINKYVDIKTEIINTAYNEKIIGTEREQLERLLYQKSRSGRARITTGVK